MIELVNNRGYKWFQCNNVHFKGYFIFDNDELCHVYKEEEACKIFEKVHSFDEFVELLRKISGNWCVIVDYDGKIWMAVDIARSMPIYYSSDGNFISDSADKIRKSLNINREDVDKSNIVELFANYYLYGNKTAYSLIKQLDLGEAVSIDSGNIIIKKYFYHLNEVHNAAEDILRKRIEDASNNTFNRLKAAIGNRPVVLSMSGGYDSRFIGCMLKKMGIEDVSCYTYGKSTSFEVIQSKKNAEALGFRWICVEMTDELQSRNLDEVGQQYFDYYNGHDFTAYMQNFTAVRKLHEEGWFKQGSVFLTGLCGDMPTGEYVEAYDEQKDYSLKSAVDYLYKTFYSGIRCDENQVLNRKEEILQVLEKMPIKIKDYQTWQSAIDCYSTGTNHVHWFMHMNTVHSFFGYEWLLPYWDKELLLAWYTIPSELKVNQKFYEDWLMDVICKPYGLSQKKSYGGYSRRPIIRGVQYFAGGIVNYILLHLGIPFKRKQDFSNFAPLELELFRNIKTKKCVNYRKAGMMRLLAIYLVEKRYGEKNAKYASAHIKL